MALFDELKSKSTLVNGALCGALGIFSNYATKAIGSSCYYVNYMRAKQEGFDDAQIQKLAQLQKPMDLSDVDAADIFNNVAILPTSAVFMIAFEIARSAGKNNKSAFAAGGPLCFAFFLQLVATLLQLRTNQSLGYAKGYEEGYEIGSSQTSYDNSFEDPSSLAILFKHILLIGAVDASAIAAGYIYGLYESRSNYDKDHNLPKMKNN